VGLVVVAACTSRETLVLPEPPIDDAIQSVVIALEGESTILHGIDLSNRPAPLLEVETDWTEQSFRAAAFEYDHPLESYDLTAGAIPVAGGPRSCLLRSPRIAYAFDTDVAGGWRAIDPLDHPLLSALVDSTKYQCTQVDFCRRFRADVVELPITSDTTLALRLDDQTALVANEGGRFFEVTRTSLIERTDLAQLPADSGVVMPDGEIWLAGSEKLVHGPRNGPFVEIAVPDSAGEDLTAFAVRDEDLLVLGVFDVEDVKTSTVVLHRLRSGEWSIIDRRFSDEAGLRQSAIHWIGDQAVIVFGDIVGLVWDGSRIDTFAVLSPIPLFEPHLTGIATHPGFGTVLGSNDGFLYELTGAPTDWTVITDAILGNGVRGVATAYEGFVFGGADGIVNQFYPGSIRCDAAPLGGSDVELIVQIGDDVLLTGGNPHRDEPNTVTWLYE
jgi:hypothetical protein